MLSILGLTKTYPGGVTALQDVSLEVPSGLFGLLGPNGSGKTTLMRVLAGLLAPTTGKIFWEGQEVTETPERIWPVLGYLPQDFGFYPHMTGDAMLRHLLALKGVEAPGGLTRLSAALLDRVNLTHAAHRPVKQYSGGMRQRLGIAQAIAGNPRLLIVDEPTAGLDPEERLRFFRLLTELAEDRVVLFSTHIVEDVAMVCARLAIIRFGHLVCVTTPQDARASLAGRVFEGVVSRADLDVWTRDQRVTQARLLEGQTLVRLVVDTGIAPQGFAPVAPTLEDAYMVLARPSAKPAA